MIKKITLAMILSLLLFSCTSDMYDLISTNNLDPFIQAPEVESFKEEHAIIISWFTDPGAEEYLLFRDIDQNGTFSHIVYRGKGLSYIDKDIDDEKFYYYKLAKRRGAKVFEKSAFVTGMSGNTCKDIYEDNNLKSQAKKLEPLTTANIYYYQDQNFNKLEDKDWYSVTLSANTFMSIQFTQFEGIYNQDISYNLEGGIVYKLAADDEFDIYNYEDVTKTIYFQVSTNKDNFIGTGSSNSGRMGSYVIKIHGIQNI